MARGRLLNQTVCASLKFHLLSNDTARLLATWTIAHLDMNGVFYGSATMVKSGVFPRRADVSLEDVEGYIKEMEALELIYRFEANGDVWQCWPGFAENQPNLRRDRERPEYPLSPGIDGRVTADCRQSDGSTPAEEKRREENIREDQEPGADAPPADAGTPPPTPSTFPEWQEEIRTSSNRTAALRRMCEALYPGLDPPDYGRIGIVASKVGGAGRLAELLWQQCTRPPTGNLMSYIQGVAKNNGKNRGNHSRLGEGTGEKATTGQAAAVAAALTAPVTDGPGRGGGDSG